MGGKFCVYPPALNALRLFDKGNVQMVQGQAVGMKHEKYMTNTRKQAEPLIGVVLGSDSDLAAMRPGLDLLQGWDIPFEVRILSAHRTPQAALQYARNARDRGIQVIIAAAGMAAHLPGVLAAHTTLPVIGVPLAARYLDGVDALYSMVQMPPGVPVATVGIGAARNAALLALRIVAVARPDWYQQLEIYQKEQEESVLAKDRKIQQLGYEEYLVAKENG